MGELFPGFLVLGFLVSTCWIRQRVSVQGFRILGIQSYGLMFTSGLICLIQSTDQPTMEVLIGNVPQYYLLILFLTITIDYVTPLCSKLLSCFPLFSLISILFFLLIQICNMCCRRTLKDCCREQRLEEKEDDRDSDRFICLGSIFTLSLTTCTYGFL